MKYITKNIVLVVSLIAYILFIYLSSLIQSCEKLEFERVVRIKTGEISNITANSASVTGIIQDVGENGITQYGHCWSTARNPSLSDSLTNFGPRNSIGTFTSNLIGLYANTTYYIKAYSTNITGLVYGDETSFKTIYGVPTLTTTAITLISDTTATGGGIITNFGGNFVTARGVCWSTSQNPTITDSKTIDGKGNGRFVSNLTGLTAVTNYYVRAYATNSAGTAYGNQVSFVSLQTGQFTDIDSNIYNSVKIGTQVWMKENLKTITYNDNTPIPNETDNAAWWNLSSPAYCWYNNSAYRKNPYGALYNWYAVNTNKICPIGWHIPSYAEWNTLVTYLGGSDVAGGKMKETGALYWKYPNIGATNESGFTALGSGVRGQSGGFADMKIDCGFWSITETDATSAFFCFIIYDNNDVAIWSWSKDGGLSVRCVRD